MVLSRVSPPSLAFAQERGARPPLVPLRATLRRGRLRFMLRAEESPSPMLLQMPLNTCSRAGFRASWYLLRSDFHRLASEDFARHTALSVGSRR